MKGVIAASRLRLKYDPDFNILLERAKALGIQLPVKSWFDKGNELMISLKEAGVYAECDLLYVMQTDGGSLEFSSLNWKNNSAYDLVNMDNPVFVNKKGIKYNGNSYSRTNWRTQLGVKYKANNAGVAFKSFDIDNSIYTVSEGIIGSRTLNNTSQFFVFRNSINTMSGRINHQNNAESSFFPVSEDFNRHIQIVKPNSTTLTNYINAQLVTSLTSSSGTLNSIETVIGALNDNGSIINRLKGGLSYLLLGSNMSTLRNNIYDIMSAYNNKISGDTTQPIDLDKIIVAELGQSNMEGRSGDTTNPLYPFPVTDAWSFDGIFDEKVLTTLRPGSILGSHSNYFAEKIKTLSGKKPIMIECARGGTGLTVQAGGQDNWSSSGNMRVLAANKINSALQFYSKETPVCALWCQGERDATAMNADPTYTKAIVKAAMQNVINWWFGLYPNSVFLISETGDVISGTNTIGYQNIRAVQNEIVAENEKVYMAFSGAKNFPVQGKMHDTDHYNYIGLKEMGEAFATTLSTLL